MKRKILMTGLLFCFVAVCAAAIIADVSGKWSGTFNAPDGNAYPLTYTFKLDGPTLTGTLETTGISVPIDSGKVDGDNVSFSVNVQGAAYTHKGKYYAAADSIGLDISYEGGKQHMKLVRPK